MQTAGNVRRSLGLFKIALLGDARVGKSSLYQQWFHQTFKEKTSAALTNSPEFFNEHKDIKTSNADATQSINLQIWEMTCDDNFDDVKSFLRDINLFIIVIDASQNTGDQLKQINKWYQFINDYLLLHNQNEIIAVFNKIDLPESNPLEKSALNVFSGKIKMFMPLSCKTRMNFSVLDRYLTRIAQDFLSIHLANKNDAIRPLSHNELSDDVSDTINSLTARQTAVLLNYLDIILKTGTNKNVQQPYKLCFFSQGESFSYDNGQNNILGAESRINGIFPKHIAPLLTAIQNGTQTAKELLNRVYVELMMSSQNEPISRRRNTQHFYAVVIPCYIKKAMQERNLAIDSSISQLLPQQAIEILNKLKTYLLKGPKDDLANPYIIGTNGGENYVYAGFLIKLPFHVFWMVKKIDLYFDLLDHNQENGVIQSRGKQILYELHQDMILAELSFNSTRHATTQEFYAHQSQDFVVNELSRFDNTLSQLMRYCSR